MKDYSCLSSDSDAPRRMFSVMLSEVSKLIAEKRLWRNSMAKELMKRRKNMTSSHWH